MKTLDKGYPPSSQNKGKQVLKNIFYIVDGCSGYTRYKRRFIIKNVWQNFRRKSFPDYKSVFKKQSVIQ